MRLFRKFSDIGAVIRDQSGIVVIMFGLLINILCICVSLPIDLGRSYMTRAAISAAADSAALASAMNAGSVPDAQKYFEANLPTGYLSIDYDFGSNVSVVLENGAVRIIPTGFSIPGFFTYNLATSGGSANLSVGGGSAANMPGQAVPSIAHFALVLDVSGSMKWGPIAGLKTATNLLIDLLEKANKDKPDDEKLLMSISTYASRYVGGVDPTFDVALLRDFVTKMVADGDTNCQEGLYVSRTQHLPKMPKDEDKFVIFMSDGVCNAIGPTAQSKGHLQAPIFECNGNPDQGIKPQFEPHVSIWTIRFGGGSQYVMDTCASSIDQSLYAGTNQELQNLFASIFVKTTKSRLVE